MGMPMKKKCIAAAQAAARGALPELPAELIDHLIKGPMMFSEVQGLMLAFDKVVIDERNGASGKTIHTNRGPVRVTLPRDRDGIVDRS